MQEYFKLIKNRMNANNSKPGFSYLREERNDNLYRADQTNNENFLDKGRIYAKPLFNKMENEILEAMKKVSQFSSKTSCEASRITKEFSTSAYSFSKEFKNSIWEGIEKGYQAGKEGFSKFDSYIHSSDFEKFLDDFISRLNILIPSESQNFEGIKDRNKRVGKKMRFILSQTTLFVTASATLGAEVGVHMFGPQGLAHGVVIGTIAGVIIILIVAGTVVFGRFNESGDLVPILL